MPAPTLRRYGHFATVAGWSAAIVSPAVPANRALVVSKVVIVSRGAVNVSLGQSAADADRLLDNYPMAANEVYTESGLVLLAGQTLYVNPSVANLVTVNVFGQEVDN